MTGRLRLLALCIATSLGAAGCAAGLVGGEPGGWSVPLFTVGLIYCLGAAVASTAILLGAALRAAASRGG